MIKNFYFMTFNALINKKLRCILSLHLIILLFFLYLSNNIVCQDSIKIKNRNSIQFEGSSIIVFSKYSIDYERLFYSYANYNGFFNIGLGKGNISTLVENYNWEGFVVPLSFSSLIGNNNHSFEFDLGVNFLIDFKDKHGNRKNENSYPIINIGYRYYSSDGVLFRVFLGYGGLGIGAGYRF